MIYFAVTDFPTINYFASIGFNLMIVMAPLLGAMALTRH